MEVEFEMSMVGELKYFLGFQINQMEDSIFISQANYAKNMVKKFGYCDADWAGNTKDRKSTSGGYFFLGNNLVSWFSKKQNSVSLSTAEAEYIAVGSSCTQLIWMKQMLEEMKHIDIRHHFIRDLVEEKVVKLEHVSSDKQVADIFTKGLDVNQFEYLRTVLGLCVVNR
ncbi:hypothetical protein LIER_28257 [Lithospermum erythrorhizon]|uniref:Gag-pol polyprotein n=1 Tax=Lithospermum erythrorhizon TaxID=34254 RepID=A0AAV3RGM6_LITER